MPLPLTRRNRYSMLRRNSKWLEKNTLKTGRRAGWRISVAGGTGYMFPAKVSKLRSWADHRLFTKQKMELKSSMPTSQCLNSIL